MKLEATSEELVRTIHAHPTLSEAIHEAAEAVAGPRNPYLDEVERVRRGASSRLTETRDSRLASA